jgi:hypothetical protein
MIYYLNYLKLLNSQIKEKNKLKLGGMNQKILKVLNGGRDISKQ